ncbi:MAG: hypothetical protein RMJ43_12905 [Chloroherpetonaceae bacterium]|nr:hypothetical protein [Chthonomonadaceae bacterium]MDW8208729.1 hypothetical protein [Chloroherpetonaceae bacterium]
MNAPNERGYASYQEAVQPPAEAIVQAALPHDRTVWMLYQRLRNEGYPPEQALAVALFHWQEASDARLRA